MAPKSPHMYFVTQVLMPRLVFFYPVELFLEGLWRLLPWISSILESAAFVKFMHVSCPVTSGLAFLATLVVTDYRLTRRIPGVSLFDTASVRLAWTRMWTPGRYQEFSHEVADWLTVLAAAGIAVVIFVGLCAPPHMAVLADAVLWSFLIIARGGYNRCFVFAYPIYVAEHEKRFAEKQKEDEKHTVQTDHAGAVAHVQSYYDENAAFLRDDYSPALLRAELRARIPRTASAEQAWDAARLLIKELEVLVQKNRERVRKENDQDGGRTQRLQKLEARIAEKRAQLARVLQNDVKAPVDVVENDAEGLEEEIRNLEQERDRLLTPT